MPSLLYQITYGGYTFNYKRLSVTQTPRYGDNGIDQTGIKYEFKIRGWITSTSQADFAIQLCQTKSILALPRKSFKVRWSSDGGNTFNILYDFEVAANGSGDDIAWGPMPGPLSISEFIGGRAAVFDWSLSVENKNCFPACAASPLGGAAPSNVLSISRKWDYQIGPDGLTTQTLTGRLEVTSSSVLAGQNADYFRYLVTPDLATNFKRESQSFNTSPDGRFMDFSITDKEAVWTLPPPISSGKVTFSINIPNAYALLADYRLSGTFTAPPTTPKSAILNQILQLAESRFPPEGAGGVTYITGSKSFEEDVYGNSVTFSMNFHAALGVAANPLDPQSGFSTFGNQPANSDGVSQNIGPYGGDGTDTSGVSATSPAPYDACNPPGGQPGIPSSGRGTVVPIVVTSNGSSTSIPGVSTPPDNSGSNQYSVIGGDVSSSHLQAPYFVFRETLSWEVDNGFRVFYPKVSGLDPLVQQTRMPKLIILQVGHAERAASDPGNAPPFPSPIYDTTQAVYHQMSQATHDPQAIAASGSDMYGISWAYKMEWKAALSSPSPLPLRYTQDPRRPLGAIPQVTNPPVIVVPPSQ